MDDGNIFREKNRKGYYIVENEKNKYDSSTSSSPDAILIVKWPWITIHTKANKKTYQTTTKVS
jgi:hypothetical protein